MKYSLLVACGLGIALLASPAAADAFKTCLKSDDPKEIAAACGAYLATNPTHKDKKETATVYSIEANCKLGNLDAVKENFDSLVEYPQNKMKERFPDCIAEAMKP